MAPACVTVKASPPIVTDPIRCAVLVFAAIEIETLPLPVPPALPATVSHEAPLVAAHSQELSAVTATVADPAAALADCAAGEIA